MFEIKTSLSLYVYYIMHFFKWSLDFLFMFEIVTFNYSKYSNYLQIRKILLCYLTKHNKTNIYMYAQNVLRLSRLFFPRRKARPSFGHISGLKNIGRRI